MAVNNGFYTTLNGLMSALNGGFAVVDYDTFVDSGKVLSSLAYTDLVNDFLTPLMNKVQKTIMDLPSYKGDLIDMYAGRLDYGVLEVLLMDKFYSMDASQFDGQTITDGQVYTGQFEVHMPSMDAVYYTESNSWSKTITIRATDLRGAFKTPEAMDKFISGIMQQVTNSLEFANETARYGVLAKMILTAYNATANVTDETAVSQHYGLVTIFNSLYSTSLTAADALQNPVFVRFAIATIKDIAKLMEKPINGFNGQNFQTFTRPEYRRLKISSIFEKAITMSMVTAFNKEDAQLGIPHETLPYWQVAQDGNVVQERLRIETASSGSSAPSEPIIAVLYDSRAIGEMIQMEDVTNTRNELLRYTNYHFLANRMYWFNAHANAVVFTLE